VSSKKSADWSRLSDALTAQEKFSDLFFDSKDLTDQERQDVLKTFVLSLHSEATGIVDAVNYKDHRLVGHAVDIQKIIYKSADAYRYILATLNLWGISASTFATALAQKDDFLHYRHKLSLRKWNGQPVVLFDMDDVLAEFRKSFCGWVTATSGHFIDPLSNEYYNATEFKRLGLNNELYFRNFIASHGLLLLERNDKYFNYLKQLRSMGYWIQIVTARPEADLTCFYDTYSWLSRNEIPADGVAFTPEKLNWLTGQKFYSASKCFAVDDSAKHVAEYVKHGVPAVVPQKTYNTEVAGLANVSYVPEDTDPLEFTKNLIAL
jgi:hypothetical protein